MKCTTAVRQVTLAYNVLAGLLFALMAGWYCYVSNIDGCSCECATSRWTFQDSAAVAWLGGLAFSFWGAATVSRFGSHWMRHLVVGLQSGGAVLANAGAGLVLWSALSAVIRSVDPLGFMILGATGLLALSSTFAAVAVWRTNCHIRP